MAGQVWYLQLSSVFDRYWWKYLIGKGDSTVASVPIQF